MLQFHIFSNNASIDLINKEGWTPLMISLKGKRFECVDMIMNRANSRRIDLNKLSNHLGRGVIRSKCTGIYRQWALRKREIEKIVEAHTRSYISAELCENFNRTSIFDFQETNLCLWVFCLEKMLQRKQLKLWTAV